MKIVLKNANFIKSEIKCKLTIYKKIVISIDFVCTAFRELNKK